jgi:hypothetical protein
MCTVFLWEFHTIKAYVEKYGVGGKVIVQCNIKKILGEY